MPVIQNLSVGETRGKSSNKNLFLFLVQIPLLIDPLGNYSYQHLYLVSPCRITHYRMFDPYNFDTEPPGSVESTVHKSTTISDGTMTYLSSPTNLCLSGSKVVVFQLPAAEPTNFILLLLIHVEYTM